MTTFTQLKTQTAELDKQANTLTQANKALLGQLQTTAAKDLVAQFKALKEQLRTTEETTLKPFRDQIKALEEQLKAAKANKDEAQALVLRAKIIDLRMQMMNAGTELQPLREQIKAIQDKLKEKEAAVKAIRDQLKPLWEQEKALWTKNQEIHAARKKAWNAVLAALKANDHTSLLAAVDTVITQQQAVIADLQQIITLKEQVAKILNDAIAAQPASN